MGFINIRFLRFAFRLAVLLLFGLAFSGADGTLAQAEPLPIEQFWTRLADIQLSLYDAPSAEALAGMAQQLEAEGLYLLPNGRIVEIRPHSLIQLLRAEEPDLDLIHDQIDALVATRASWETANYGDAELQKLQQILADPQFDYTPPAPNLIQEFLGDVWLKINEFIARLLPRRIQGVGAVRTLITWVGGFGLIILLASVLYSLTRSFYTEASGVGLDDEDEENLTADLALNRAHEFSMGGDYRTAVRYLYLSALLLLEEQGLLRYDRSLTNREYLRSVAHKPEFAVILRNVVEVFDRVWYGFQPLAASEYNEYVKQVDILKQQRPER